MWKKIIILIITICLYLTACYQIYSKYKTPITKITTTLKEKQIIPNKQEDEPIGKLIIKKINLEEELYPIESKENNVEKHITILNYSSEPSIKNSTIFIAAHSGTGPLAYFENLDKLSINDTIILEYKNITYKYKVKNIWEDKKIGTITVPKENTNQLVLTTCSPNKDNYQLTINSVLVKTK